jgi:hypothetical protein
MTLKHVKKDRALLMTSILLVLMLGAGLFSGIIGFTLGHAALKGVTQPDIRPSNKSINQQNLKTRGLEVIGEQQMLAQARDLMGLPKQGEDDKSPQFSNSDKPTLVFPIEGKDQGIILIVKSAQPEGNNIKLEASLRNQGSQAVKLEPGVLTLRDDREQPLNASIVGLPSNLAANGKDVGIKILVPKGEIGISKTVSLNLTDADRKLQLEMSDIPVVTASPATTAKPKPKSTMKLNIPDGELTEPKEDEDKKISPSPNPSTKSSPKASPQARASNKPAPAPRASAAQ